MVGDDFICVKYSAGRREPIKGDMVAFKAEFEGSIYSTGKECKIEIECTVCRDNNWCELKMIETNQKLRQRTISVTLPIMVADKLADWIKNGEFLKS